MRTSLLELIFDFCGCLKFGHSLPRFRRDFIGTRNIQVGVAAMHRVKQSETVPGASSFTPFSALPYLVGPPGGTGLAGRYPRTEVGIRRLRRYPNIGCSC